MRAFQRSKTVTMKIRHYEFNPSEALRPYVECYWYQNFDGDIKAAAPIQRCVPLGMTEIIFHLNEHDCEVFFAGEWRKLPHAFVVGVYKDAVIWKSTGGCRIFGIRMKPEALIEIFNIPAAMLANDYADIHDFFGRDMSALTGSIIGETHVSNLIAYTERFLLGQMKYASRQMNYVSEATRMIRASKGNLRLETLSEQLYISERQLQRSFKDGIGISPKAYQRIIRFRNAYEYLQHTADNFSWADVSYSFGYSDQAHVIRDFKQFTGAVPTALLLQSEEFQQMTTSLN